MIFRDANQKGVMLAGIRMAARGGKVQRGNVAMKTAFGFQLQDAGDVRFRKFWQVDMSRQRPFEGQADDAIPFLDPRGIEMIANFAADKFGRRSERIERE